MNRADSIIIYLLAWVLFLVGMGLGFHGAMLGATTLGTMAFVIGVLIACAGLGVNFSLWIQWLKPNP